MCSRRLGWFETREPRHYHRTQRAHSNAIQAGWYFHYRGCPRTQCRPGGVCVASPNAAAARGDAAQAAFNRKLSHDNHEIPDLRNQGIHCRPLVWTADWRPHPAVTRTLQFAADIASSRNGQQMSAEPLQHRWKHEIQIALLRQRVAMTRAVLPNPSARAERLLADIIDRARNSLGPCSSS